MLLDDQRTLLIIAIPVILVLELWRRSLRHRAPRWMHVVAALLVMAIAGGVAYSQWELSHLAERIGDVDASSKASRLAGGLQTALMGNLIAFASAIAAVILLAIATWKARGVPEDGPEARAVDARR